MRVMVVNPHVPFIYGGAEVLAENLTSALIQHGHQAELLRIPYVASTPQHILDQMLAYRLFDLGDSGDSAPDLIVGLKFPAYLIQHPNKIVWLCHQEKGAYELWDSVANRDNPTSLSLHPQGSVAREAIFGADQHELGSLKRGYTISKTVSDRLSRNCGIDFEFLYPPTENAEQFHCKTYEPFLFFPSRISSHKRHELTLRALALSDSSIRLVISGKADTAAAGNRLIDLVHELGIEERVEFTGWISNEEKLDLYARCRGVIFPPFDEDYGYITAEAMLASKPVVTCTDSGGPLELLVANETGLVADPNPESLAAMLNKVWIEEAARAMGRAGREHYKTIAVPWGSIVETLTAK